jgi:hypothetical protein
MKIEAPALKVMIAAKAKDQIDHWVDMALGEVSGMGLVESVEGGFLISEVFLPFQQCYSASTVIEPSAVAKLMIEIEMLGFDSSKLKFWWHSHGPMKTFWSATDDNTIGGFKPQDYFISMVVNKHGHSLTRIDYYNPFRVIFQDVDTQLKLPTFNQRELCQHLFDERVSEGRIVFHQADCNLFDLTPQELVNKVTTGEIEWEEAEEVLEWQQERDYGRFFDEYD